MKKWTALGPAEDLKKWQFLSEKIKQLGCENEFELFTADMNTLEDLSALEGFDHFRISTKIGAHVLQKLKVQSSWITMLGVSDGILKTSYGWWPLCALYEALGQFIIELGSDLDNRGNVLIAGAGGAARTAIAAFFKGGFKKFLLTNFNEQEALSLIKEMNSRFFGAEIVWTPMESIVLLPGESSVLINCTPAVKENLILTELSYLNFLKRPGLLFDFDRPPQGSVLTQEATDAGVKVISGFQVAARVDSLWAEWAFKVKLDPAQWAKEMQDAFHTLV